MSSDIFPWLFLTALLLVALIQFGFWIKKMGWIGISKKYPMPKKPELIPIKLKYARANIGGTYRWNSVFSGITNNGVYIRKPFPFSLMMPPINIPWSGIDSINIVNSIDKETKDIRFKFGKYADIKLSSINTFVIIPWKEKYRINIPSGLLHE